MLIYNDEPILFQLGDTCVDRLYLQDQQVYPCVSGNLNLELIPNYNTIGIRFDYSGSDEVGYVYYKESGQCGWNFGHDTNHILDHAGDPTNVHMSTIFNLSEGTNYEVCVAFKDGSAGQSNITTRTTPTKPTPVRIRYVSPNGTGISFTSGDPGSIEDAIDDLTTGDEIRLMDGTYYTGGHNKFSNGIDNITFINNSGDTPIINGSISNTNELTWTLESSGIYSTSKPNDYIHQIIVDDIRYYFREDGLSGLVNTGSGFYTDTSNLYVKLIDGTSPSGHDIQVPEAYTGTAGFFGFIGTFSDSWWFEGIKFEYFGNGPNTRVIYLSNSPDSMIKDCTFRFIKSTPIYLTNCIRMTIQGNTFEDNTQWMDDFKYVKSNSPLPSTNYHVEFVCRVNIAGNEESANMARQVVVRNNNWTGGTDVVGLVPTTSNSEMAPTIPQHCIDIHDNYHEFSPGEGIDLDGGWSNVRVFNNSVYSSAFGVGMATSVGGPFYIINHCCDRMGLHIPNESPPKMFAKEWVKWNSNLEHDDYIAACFFYHNTYNLYYPGVHPDRAYGCNASEPLRTFQLLVQKNNIIKTTRYLRYYTYINTVTGNNYVFDNNILYSTNAGIKYRADSDFPTSLAEWQSITNLDLTAIEADPLITGDCVLLPGSPASGNAVYIRGISDWIGHNNIGAK